MKRGHYSYTPPTSVIWDNDRMMLAILAGGEDRQDFFNNFAHTIQDEELKKEMDEAAEKNNPTSFHHNLSRAIRSAGRPIFDKRGKPNALPPINMKKQIPQSTWR